MLRHSERQEVFDELEREAAAEQRAREDRLLKLAHGAEAIREKALAGDWDGAQTGLRAISAQFLGRNGVGQKRDLPFMTSARLASEESPTVWIARPWVASGCITELAGKVKLAGKTTFATHLVRAVLDGAPFLGQPTRRSPVVYLTEQPPSSFRATLERAGLLGREDLFVLCWKDVALLSWPAIAAGAVEQCKKCGAGLLIVDSFGQFARLTGDSENDAGSALEAMRPLQAAAGQGLGVQLLRHERKSGGELSDAGRGSSAISGAVDIVLSLRRGQGNSRGTVRVLHALSRFEETPVEPQVVELTGGGYLLSGSHQEVAVQEGRRAILNAAPAQAEKAMKLKELAKAAGIPRSTAQRAVDQLAGEGIVTRVGTGRRGDPYRYFVSAQLNP